MYFFSYFQVPATRVSRPYKTRVSGFKNRQKSGFSGYEKTRVGNHSPACFSWWARKNVFAPAAGYPSYATDSLYACLQCWI